MREQSEYARVPTLVSDDGRAIRYAWGSVFFFFRYGSGLADFDAVASECDQMLRKHRKMMLVVVSNAATSNRGAPSTERIRAETTRLGPHLYGQATVILGVGFLASALIAIAGAIMRLLPHKYPREIFRDGHAAGPFMLAQMRAQGIAVEAADIDRALTHVLSRVGGQATVSSRALPA